MDRCPTEILSSVFAHACTDDGQTGRALSLVSKRIHAASRRYANQSVALYGSYQISAFAARLDRARPEERRVRHLYLTDRRRVWMEYRPGQDRSEWLRERIEEDFQIMDPSREYSPEPIVRILLHVCSSLRICTMLFFDRYEESGLPAGVTFPLMREMTLYGSIFTFHGSFSLPKTPALRRFHFIQDHSLRKSLPRLVSVLAPSLTHLRISRLVNSGDGAKHIADGLERMLRPDDPAFEDRDGFPRSLERVIIQTSQQELLGPTGDANANTNLLTSPMAHRLKDIAMRDPCGRVILLRPYLWDPVASFTGGDKDVEYYMGVKEAWEKSVAGLEGIWEVDHSDILATRGYFAGEPVADSASSAEPPCV